MKKTFLITALTGLISLITLTGCADAVVNDGNNVRKYVGNSAGENGGTVPFSMYNDVMDFQSWTDYNGGCTTLIQDGALVITQSGAWYGLAICSDASCDDKNGAVYDLSDVAKITFEAKAQTSGQKMKLSMCTENLQEFELTDEYQSFEYDATKAEHALSGTHYCIVSIVQNDITSDVVHYIKNIAFFDASGNEIVPEISE